LRKKPREENVLKDPEKSTRSDKGPLGHPPSTGEKALTAVKRWDPFQSSPSTPGHGQVTDGQKKDLKFRLGPRLD